MATPSDPTARAARGEALLAGPRGRRMLLELAIALDARGEGAACDKSLRQAVHHAAWHLDPALSPVPLTTTIGSSGGGGRAAVPRVSLPRVAKLLRRVQIGELGEELLRTALGDAARYAVHWDAPFAEEALAATPAATAELRRFADAVTSSGLIDQWCAPLDDRAQWAVQWQDEPFPKPLDASRSALTAAMRLLAEDEARERPCRPADLADASLSEWASKPPRVVPASTRAAADGAPLKLYAYEDGFKLGEARVQRLDIPEGLHVYEIDSAEAWAELCRTYPLDVTESVRRNWAMTTGRDGAWVIPDWAAVAERFDGVHLQIGAYLSVAGAVIDLDDERASMIAGWDADETYWLSDRVRYVGDPVRWELDPALWAPAWRVAK